MSSRCPARCRRGEAQFVDGVPAAGPQHAKRFGDDGPLGLVACIISMASPITTSALPGQIRCQRHQPPTMVPPTVRRPRARSVAAAVSSTPDVERGRQATMSAAVRPRPAQFDKRRRRSSRAASSTCSSASRPPGRSTRLPSRASSQWPGRSASNGRPWARNRYHQRIVLSSGHG